jgi:hypothetical protein
MLKIEYKILPKKKGFYLPQLIAKREYLESDDLKLNPRFVFKKEYPLPAAIFFAEEKEMTVQQSEVSASYCKKITSLAYDIDEYIRRPCSVHITTALNHKTCPASCSLCKAFLEWRPGTKPDYSDFVAVFEQVCRDMIEAWKKAVAEAEASGENDEIEIVMSSDSYTQIKVEETRQRPSRKLKIDNVK